MTGGRRSIPWGQIRPKVSLNRVVGEQGSQSEEASSASCLDPFDLGATYFQIRAILSLFTAIQGKHDEARLGSVEIHSIV